MEPRFNLPGVTFTEKSAAKIETDFLANYEALTGQTLGRADPRRKFAQSVIMLLTQQRVLIDQSAKQNLLAYATGDYLDNLGAPSNTERLDPDVAVTTIRLTLTDVLTQAKAVEAGIQVTAGDNVFFVLPTFTAPIGQGTVDIEAACTVTGPIGNGYIVGQINKLVKPLAWVASVENITESDGGSDIEADDPYADRIHLAPEKFSVAGPDGAYEYWAKTASQLIIDVSVRSPSEGVVEVRPLMQGGAMPGQEILDAVDSVLNIREIRPLTDHVITMAPEQISYEIDVTYWINTDDDKIAIGIQAKVNQAITDYRTWQKSKLGRDIDPSELTTRVKNAGAKRAIATLPEYLKLVKYQVASEGTVTVTYGGLEDD